MPIIMGFEHISNRILTLRILDHFYNTTTVNGQAPTETADREENEQFYVYLCNVYHTVSKYDSVIVMEELTQKSGKKLLIRTWQESIHYMM
jgi:hypothetical protein